jgi:hypothetical protein
MTHMASPTSSHQQQEDSRGNKNLDTSSEQAAPEGGPTEQFVADNNQLHPS